MLIATSASKGLRGTYFRYQVPPFACSFVFGIIASYFSDKYKCRGLMATFCALIAAAGYAIFLGVCLFILLCTISSEPTYICFTSLASGSKDSDYGALFLQIIGIYSLSPCLVTWNANNMQPHYRRATAVAVGVTSVSFGGIASTWLYTDAPRFHKATCINLASSLVIAVASIGLIFYFRSRNAEKHRQVQHLLHLGEQGKEDEGWDSPKERRKLGDRHPRFEYTM